MVGEKNRKKVFPLFHSLALNGPLCDGSLSQLADDRPRLDVVNGQLVRILHG